MSLILTALTYGLGTEVALGFEHYGVNVGTSLDHRKPRSLAGA